MNTFPRIVIAVATLLGCGRVADSVGAQARPITAVAPRATGQVVVEVVGCHNDRGQLLAALYASASGFPGDGARAFARAIVPVQGGRARVVFDRVPAGPFAVALVHDEDSDFKMSTGIFGVPREGYGFSRDARGSFGPPSFDDSRVALGADERKQILIHVSY